VSQYASAKRDARQQKLFEDAWVRGYMDAQRDIGMEPVRPDPRMFPQVFIAGQQEEITLPSPLSDEASWALIGQQANKMGLPTVTVATSSNGTGDAQIYRV
jgi:hypothetical protein